MQRDSKQTQQIKHNPYGFGNFKRGYGFGFAYKIPQEDCQNFLSPLSPDPLR